MGCSQCDTIEEPANDNDLEELRDKMNEEYTSYLIFLKNLKNDLNISICNSEEINNNHQNNIIKKEFNIIPANWFENWEKRIEYISKNNKFKSYNCIFEYKNLENRPKFYFEFITKEIWGKIFHNKNYNIKMQPKIKDGTICNNLIIFKYLDNNIEIFFFEKDEDLFFTNLLFTFENSNDGKKESENLLQLLKTSPIHEIFGNMHYDYSRAEFTEQNKKIVIYNKTRKVPEEIRNFRKEKYEILLKNSSQNEYNSENININNNIYTYNKNNEEKIDNYLGHKNEKDYLNNKFNNNNIYNVKGDNHMNSNELSRASTIMVGNNLNILKNNISNTNIFKINQLNNENQESYSQEINNKNNNDTTPNASHVTISRYKINSTPLQRKMADNEQKRIAKNKMLVNNGEFSSLVDNKFKGESNFDKIKEETINETLLESVLYCLYNVKELTEYILKNNTNNNSNNTFYNYYIKIVEFLHLNNSKKLLRNCKDYNYDNLLNLIIYQNGFNIISKIIDKLHSELNSSQKKEGIKYNNSITEENMKKEEEKNKKLNEFIKQTKENNNSIIYDLFYGIKEIKAICNNCNKTSYIYDILNVLELSREKIIQYYKAKDNNNNINITIEDCLNYYKKEEKHQDKELFNCPFCKDYQNYMIYNDICKWSDIFIIYFSYEDNFNENVKEELKININETINLLSVKYEIFGIIVIKNRNIKNNDEECKYIAYSRK